MKELEVRRHTDDDGDELTEDGIEAAIALGRASDASWDIVVTTGAQRTTQTAANVLAASHGSVAGGVVVERGLRSDVEERWRAAYADVGSGHLDELRAADAELVEQQTAVLGEALEAVLERLDDGQRALVIGHSPTSEAAVLGLTGETIEPLSKGAGVLVRVDGGDFELEELSAAT